jgi:RimJ/RimL family protein N-acetyltransferase
VDILGGSHWGGRYNREMKQLMLRHAFQFVKHVVFRSQKAIEKLGGVRVRSRPDTAGRDSCVYGITSVPV